MLSRSWTVTSSRTNRIYSCDGIPALGAHYLSDDLAALYVWLERGLVIFDYENDDALADAIWHWVGGFEFEHGDVLVAAVLATYWATQRSPN